MCDQGFWQGEHNHPLFLFYKGEKCSEYVQLLTEIFGEARTTNLPSKHLGEVMQHLMPHHFSNKENEYFAYCNLPGQTVLFAFNHRFHDAASIGLLFQRAPLRECYVPAGVKKLPPGPPPDMKPTPVSSVELSLDFLTSMKNKFSLSRNEIAFLIATSAILRQKGQDAVKMMCLHTQRKVQDAASIAGGDFSCSVIPFVPSVSQCESNESLVDAVREYFNGLRSGDLVIRSSTPPATPVATTVAANTTGASSATPEWLFDTWVGAGVGRPSSSGSGGGSGSSDFELDMASISMMYSYVCRNLILPVDLGDTVWIYMFSESVQLSQTVDVEYWI